MGELGLGFKECEELSAPSEAGIQIYLLFWWKLAKYLPSGADEKSPVILYRKGKKPPTVQPSQIFVRYGGVFALIQNRSAFFESIKTPLGQRNCFPHISTCEFISRHKVVLCLWVFWECGLTLKMFLFLALFA